MFKQPVFHSKVATFRVCYCPMAIDESFCEKLRSIADSEHLATLSKKRSFFSAAPLLCYAFCVFVFLLSLLSYSTHWKSWIQSLNTCVCDFCLFVFCAYASFGSVLCGQFLVLHPFSFPETA